MSSVEAWKSTQSSFEALKSLELSVEGGVAHDLIHRRGEPAGVFQKRPGGLVPPDAKIVG